MPESEATESQDSGNYHDSGDDDDDEDDDGGSDCMHVTQLLGMVANVMTSGLQLPNNNYYGPQQVRQSNLLFLCELFVNMRSMDQFK